MPADSVWLGGLAAQPAHPVSARFETHNLGEPEEDAFVHEVTAERRSLRREFEAQAGSAENPFDDSLDASDEDVLVDDSSVDEALSSIELRVETAVVDMRKGKDARATTSEPTRSSEDDD